MFKRFYLFAFISLLSSVVLAQQKYTVSLPEAYNKNEAYPLFIALHGGHGNMTGMQTYWKSALLKKEFIVVYMEASTLDRAPNRYGWRNLINERANIKRYYEEITSKFRITKDQVFIGGFSLGAKTSIDLTLGNIIPINGFVLLNLGGGLSDNCTQLNVVSAKNRNVRGVVMIGEKDHKYKEQSLALKTLLDNEKFNYKFIVNKNTGHTTPKNFEQLLDSCIQFIME